MSKSFTSGRFSPRPNARDPTLYKVMLRHRATSSLEAAHLDSERRRLIEEQEYYDQREAERNASIHLKQLEEKAKLTTVEHLRTLSLKRELVSAQTFQEEFLLSFAEREEAVPLHLAFPSRHWLDTKAACMTGRGFYHSPTGMFSSSARLTERFEGNFTKKRPTRQEEKSGWKRKRSVDTWRREPPKSDCLEEQEESSSSHSGGGEIKLPVVVHRNLICYSSRASDR